MRTLSIARTARFFSVATLALPTLLGIGHVVRSDASWEQARMCLAENLYHEGRGLSKNERYMIGMITLARVADPRWPNTICGVVGEEKQFSWTLDYKLATTRSEQKKWAGARDEAKDLIEGVWTRYALPSGWECARWYKRTDGKGVSRKSLRFFETRLFPVGSMGTHTAFMERHGCAYPLPTS